MEKGKTIEGSKVISAVASDIIKKSKYAEKSEKLSTEFEGTMLDDTELGFELGYGKEIPTEDGTLIKKVKWPESSIPEIYHLIQERVAPEKPLKINGVRANFVICAICKAAKQKGVRDISVYDIRTKSYIPIRDLPKIKDQKQAKGLSYSIIENKDNVFIDVDITKGQYSLEDYKKCILPQIKEGKKLFLSGRIPLWLLASIGSSYDASKIYTFQPGKGFTCISSKDERDLGTMVDGIDGININQYFKDKQDKTLPVVAEKKGILSKIKSMLSNLRKKIDYSKYLDETIKSSAVMQEQTSFVQSTNQEQLTQSIHKNVSTKSKSEDSHSTETLDNYK